MRRDLALEAILVEKFSAVSSVLDERGRRLWAAAESRVIGYGGDSVVSSATGLARETIRGGRSEIEAGGQLSNRIRRPGAGRPFLRDSQPGLEAALERLVDPETRGDPVSPLRWTCKSRAKLAAALSQEGWRVSSTTVGRMLNKLGYRLQSVRKRNEGTSHPDRNAQFEHINATADQFFSQNQPVISVDTKKKASSVKSVLLLMKHHYLIAFTCRKSSPLLSYSAPPRFRIKILPHHVNLVNPVKKLPLLCVFVSLCDSNSQ